MTKPVNPKLVLIAMIFLAGLASVVGVLQFSERQHLLKQGIETTGVVVGIDVGVRGIRSVEARFTTVDGQRVVGLDVHKTQWINANEIGERVSLHYNPQEPQKILIDHGLWTWSNPVFLLAGGALLCGLGVFIYRRSTGRPIAR